MGAKTWMVVYGKENPKEVLKSYPALDRDATIALVGKLFASEKLLALQDSDLSFTNLPDNEIVAACFPGLVVVAAKEFCIDYPSKLPAKFVDTFSEGILFLHALHSVVDWFAFAVWNSGRLQRSLSLSPDSGIIEDIGTRLPFEEPYWAGDHPAVDPDEDDAAYPLVFHPLELGAAALQELFGYGLEGLLKASQLEPERIPLMRFKRKKVWWRFG